jgi:TrmH family RNA methyltransferase
MTLSNNQIKLINSLHSKKGRIDNNLFLVEGEKGIRELLDSSFKIEFIVLNQKEIQSDLNFGETPIYYESENNVIKYSSLTTNEYGFAIVHSKIFAPNDFSFNLGYTVVLDGIRDPGNLGTILRICDWYGINQLVCSMDTTEYYNPKVISASMGSFHRIKFLYVDVPEFLDQFSGIPMIGASLDGNNVHEYEFPLNGFIVFGNESEGIRSQVKGVLTDVVKIPSWGMAESLNVAISAGVILDNIKRQN